MTDISNAQNQRVQLTYYPCSGLRQARRDENDILNNRAGTTFTYDLMGRPAQTSFSDGGQTSMAYSDQIPFIATTTTKITGTLNLVDEVEYDGLNRPRVTRRTSDPQGTVFTRTTYDFAGRISQSWNPTRCNPDVGNCGEGAYGITQTVYDGLGRVTKVIPPDGSTTANNITTAYSGNTATVTDQAGKARRTITDALGRLSEVVEDPGGAAYSTTYAYDAQDNLTTVTQGAQTRTFVYDSLSQLRSALNPESGTTLYSYDANGNLETRTDPRTTLTTYGYDNLDRLTSKLYTIAGLTTATPNVTYTYEGLANTCNAKGRLTSVSSAASTSNVACFDAMGRPTQTSQTTSGGSYPFSYSYDLAGNLTTEGYPSGKTINAAIDGAGRIARLQRQDGMFWAADASTTIQYTPHGAQRRVKLGNGLWEETRFNARLQPAQVGVGQAAASTLEAALDTTNANRLLLEFGYGLGTANNSNVLSQAIRIGTTTFSQTYTYDALNRILTAGETGGWSASYVNDRYGNMKPAGAAYSFVETTNRLNTGGGYQYDAGNLTVDPYSGSFAYDAENRLTGFNAGNAQLNASYEYDADGRRVKKVQGGATTIFVYDAAGRLAAEYSTATSGTSGTQYLTGDTLGSNRLVTDSAGNVVSRHDYYPYGEEIAPSVNGRTSIAGYSTADTIRQRFTGKERDAESKLDFFGARYYSGALGRFTSVDPLARSASAALPQSWNRYGYTLNNPLRYVDPSGKCSAPAGIKPGQVGICIGSYISSKTIGGIGRGDGRGPVGNDPSASFKAQVQLIIDPSKGSVESSKTEAGRSGIVLKGLGPKGTATTKPVEPKVDEKGNTNVTVTTTATNGFSEKVFPPIDISIGLTVTPDGKVGVAGGTRDGYPSLEVYAYDSDGKVIPILQIYETKPSDLEFPMEQKIPMIEPRK